MPFSKLLISSLLRDWPCERDALGLAVVEERSKVEDGIPPTMKEFPPFRLDVVNQCLWRHSDRGDDERILLTPKTLRLLRYLVEHARRLVTHDELLDAVWSNTHVQPQVACLPRAQQFRGRVRH